MRSKRIVTLTTLPHWSKASKSMRREAEFRLHCLEEPIGYFHAYEVTTAFDDGDIRTRRLDEERIAFPDMAGRNDPKFETLAAKKDSLLEAATTDADDLYSEDGDEALDPEEAREAEKREIAQTLRDDGYSAREAGEVVGRSHTWILKHTAE
jgi:hypothetical protein